MFYITVSSKGFVFFLKKKSGMKESIKILDKYFFPKSVCIIKGLYISIIDERILNHEIMYKEKFELQAKNNLPS